MKIFISIFFLLFSWCSYAADVNGYTAKYECRSSGLHCSVDVVSLGNCTADATITTADSAAIINTKLNSTTDANSDNVICTHVTNGDYTSKGAISITASGTASVRRVLRYVRSGDTDDEPWNQSGANQATFKRIVLDGNYWIIHRIRIARSDSAGRNETNGTENIWNRILVENSTVRLFRFQGTNTTLQNSVIRNAGDDFTAATDEHCVDSGGGDVTGGRVVNNEIYNCTGDGFQNNASTVLSGFVIENNDFYITSAYTAPAAAGRACAEQGIDIKHPVAVSGNPARIIHNRFWGFKRTDTSCGGTGSSGEGIIVNGDVDPADWVLIQNNIFMDMPAAVGINAGSGGNVSIIGCLIYNINDAFDSTAQALKISDSYSTEIYFNSIIGAPRWINMGSSTGNDYRCNAIIDSGTHTGSLGTNSQINHNTYYGVSGTKLDATSVDKTLNTRANGTSYSEGDIIRTTATPPANGTAGDFLYKVTVAGQSAGSPPSYCTSIGCTTTDGTMTVQAIRGPYTFKRKLRTVAGGETSVIPYARAGAGAFEAGLCPSHIGSLRSGIGVDNTPIN